MHTVKQIRVMCVDDHPLLREGIASVVNDESDMTLAAEASNGLEAIETFRTYRPDVTLMDLQMSGMNGIDSLLAILREFPDARIIIVTTYSGDAQARRALQAGAVGYLLKSMLRKELVDTIRTIHAGKRYIPSDVALSIVDHADADNLSCREIELLKLVASGHSNRDAATNLGLSEGTVKSYMKSILSKLSANDRAHAVSIAIKRGFLEG